MTSFGEEAASASARRAQRQDDQQSTQLLESLRSCLAGLLPEFAAAARRDKLRTNWKRMLHHDAWFIQLTIQSSYAHGEVGIWISWNGDWNLPHSPQYKDSELPYRSRVGFENYMVLESSDLRAVDVADG